MPSSDGNWAHHVENSGAGSSPVKRIRPKCFIIRDVSFNSRVNCGNVIADRAEEDTL